MDRNKDSLGTTDYTCCCWAFKLMCILKNTKKVTPEEILNQAEDPNELFKYLGFQPDQKSRTDQTTRNQPKGSSLSAQIEREENPNYKTDYSSYYSYGK